MSEALIFALTVTLEWLLFSLEYSSSLEAAGCKQQGSCAYRPDKQWEKDVANALMGYT